MPTTPRTPYCLHCQRPFGVNLSHAGRNLCYRCNKDPAVRECYPPLRRTAPPKRPAPPEPTAEEVEAVIAVQMQNLPPWWAAAEAAQGAAEAATPGGRVFARDRPVPNPNRRAGLRSVW